MPLVPGHNEATIGHNIREMVEAGHPQRQAVAAAMRVARQRPGRAEGGETERHEHSNHGMPEPPRLLPPEIPKPNDQLGPMAHGAKLHVGAIHSAVAGRTDHLPMHVPSGSYVIPADIISAMGEGNTSAGFKVAKSIFEQPVYGEKELGAGGPYRQGDMPYAQPAVGHAEGGAIDPAGEGVPIVAAGGEYVVAPHHVMRLGNGSLDDGHKILDQFVKRLRAKTVQTLSKLPGPKTK